jgi:hypothetical protein
MEPYAIEKHDDSISALELGNEVISLGTQIKLGAKQLVHVLGLHVVAHYW